MTTDDPGPEMTAKGLTDDPPVPAITVQTAKDILDQLWAGVFAGAHDSALYDELIRNGWPKHDGADAAEPPETDAEFMASVAPFLPPATARIPPLVVPDYAAPRTAVNDVTNALAAERLAAWRRGEDPYGADDFPVCLSCGGGPSDLHSECAGAAAAERERVAEVVASHATMDPSWHPQVFDVLRRDHPEVYAVAVGTAVSENARRLVGERERLADDADRADMGGTARPDDPPHVLAERVGCPVCWAEPGQLCSEPYDDLRRGIPDPGYHPARLTRAMKSADAG